MQWIDLRSDTVTQPTPEMRQAMAEAEVGDDVYGDDPTVLRMEKLAAERMGKEAAVFVPSGTMGNLAAVLSHCRRGDEIIVGDQADGTMDLEEILEAIRSDDPHYPVSRLIVLENTHNRTGGSVLSQGYTEAVAKIASQNNLKVHLDGARIFNAAAALGIEAASLAKDVESVTFCLSKGLCAPVGSVLCGSEDFIRRARRARKLLGGGMRQAGVLAAAGIVALETMVDRLSEDHARARRLADGLRDIPEIAFFQDPPPTNMLIISIDPDSGITTEDLIPRLAQDGIKVVARDSHNMRLVTHYWITDEAVDLAVAAFARAMT